MRRRELLGAAGAAAIGGLAGCGGLFETRTVGEPPVLDDRPDAVYNPTHTEGMAMAGTDDDGVYRCALTYSYPHRFWTVTGDHRNRAEVADDDTLHLMPVVWHRDTGIVPADVNPAVTITRDGEAVTAPSPWVMLSQPMGVHFGDNVQLEGEGSYAVTVEVGGGSARRTGALADTSDSAAFEFDFEFSQSELEEVAYRDLDEDVQGTRGAVDPMEMEMLPTTRAPAEDDLPGTVHGSVSSGDARFVVATLADAARFGGDEGERYLAVSPRTPYNRYVIPGMNLTGTVTRDGETVFDGELTATIDPELRHHYGAAVPGVEAGDELTVTVDTPPQIARHEGYEMAFFDMDDVTVTL